MVQSHVQTDEDSKARTQRDEEETSSEQETKNGASDGEIVAKDIEEEINHTQQEEAEKEDDTSQGNEIKDLVTGNDKNIEPLLTMNLIYLVKQRIIELMSSKWNAKNQLLDPQKKRKNTKYLEEDEKNDKGKQKWAEEWEGKNKQGEIQEILTIIAQKQDYYHVIWIGGTKEWVKSCNISDGS